MLTLTWREKAVRLVGAVIVTAGASLAFAAPSAVASTPPEPKPASGHPHGDDHPAHDRSNGKSAADKAADKDAAGKDTTADDPTPAPPDSASAKDAAGQQRDNESARDRNGDNGTVKVHRSTTPADDRRNEPKVCSFYLVGFGFDADENVSWRIRSWPPTGDRTVVASGGLTLDEVGHGRTANLSLSDGHYKLFWNFEGEKGFAKQKVFWVRCPAESPSPSASPTTAAPTPTETAPGAQPPAEEPPAEEQPPSKNRGASLPFTGFPLWLAAAVALALLLGGTTIVWAAHRRT